MDPAASSAADACRESKSRRPASSRSSSSRRLAASLTFRRSRSVSATDVRLSSTAASLAACAASAATSARIARSTASSRSAFKVSMDRSIFAIAVRASRSRRLVTSRSSAVSAAAVDRMYPGSPVERPESRAIRGGGAGGGERTAVSAPSAPPYDLRVHHRFDDPARCRGGAARSPRRLVHEPSIDPRPGIHDPREGVHRG
mmetsp:Transcript_9388/g.42799  ORF Transcript_9388/g.42799 Transcript_9388/m.42799 type:complete len:201 (+) Transcript_9388:2384-2986(+)